MARRASKDDVPEEARREALRREAVIRPLAGRPRLTVAAVDAPAEELGLKRARIYRLIAAYRAQAVTSALIPPPPGPHKGSHRLDPERESLVEEAIRRVYRTRQKPSIAALLGHIAHECRRRGVEPVSRKAVAARLRAVSPKALLRDREGAKAASDRFRPVRTTYDVDHALQIVEIDHTKLDVFVVDEIQRVPIGRPWLTLAIDIASRMVAGFYLSLEAPSASAVALALHHAVLPKEVWLARLGISASWPVTGLMDVLHMDNGKEFHSRALARGAGQYGIRLQYRPPATPRPSARGEAPYRALADAILRSDAWRASRGRPKGLRRRLLGRLMRQALAVAIPAGSAQDSPEPGRKFSRTQAKPVGRSAGALRGSTEPAKLTP
jgi:putative transposase